MKFWTIWTMSWKSMTIRERLIRTQEWSAMQIAAKLPLRVRYWATLQEIGKATRNSPNIPATPLNEILRNLESPKVDR